jgi:hypothetical protein
MPSSCVRHESIQVCFDDFEIDRFFFFALINYGLPNRVGRVFSEKMKNASTHYETEYMLYS